MNTTGKRKNRGNPGIGHGRYQNPAAHRGGGGGGGRQRGNMMEKHLQIEGIYTNPRFMHAVFSVVGCVVQVQVRNRGVYEGVLKTFSPKFEIVLDMAHKIEELGQKHSVPSRDCLIETVVFNFSDIVLISAASVDLDYASKDTFTDSAISKKFNGQAQPKELQPWDAEATGELLEALEGETLVTAAATTHAAHSPSPSGSSAENVNGWDPNDMFKTNAEQFNYESSYDPTLTGYTTQLKPENTKEWRDREEKAARLAQEIERSESYRAHIELENGEGDEEDKFSAVVRPNEANNPSKYVPPHLRSKGQPPPASRQIRQGGMGKMRDSPSPGQSPPVVPHMNTAPIPSGGRGPPPQQQQPPLHQSPLQHQQSPTLSHISPIQHHQQHQPQMPPSPHQPHPQHQQQHPQQMPQRNINGDKDDRLHEPPGVDYIPGKISDLDSSNNNVDTHIDSKERSPSLSNRVDRKTSNPKERDQQIKELKEFSSTFKLSDKEDRKSQIPQQITQQQRPDHLPQLNSQQPQPHLPPMSQPQAQLQQQAPPPQQTPQPPQQPPPQQQQPPQQQMPPPQQPPRPEHHQSVQNQSSAPPTQHVPEKSGSEERGELEGDKKDDMEKKKLEETAAKSTLNPNAKEFVFNPKAPVFTPKAAQPQPQQQPLPVATPPRPQTQSPGPGAGMMQQIPPMMYSPYTIMSNSLTTVVQPTQQPRFPSKRAVVSVQPGQEFNPAAQAAAATGQPLLQTPIAPQTPQYTVYHMPAGPAGPAPGAPLSQVGPMSAAAPRMVVPHMGQPQPQHQASEQGGPQPQQTTVFVSGPPLSTHLGPHHQGAPHQGNVVHHPAHVAPHHHATPPHSQPSHAQPSQPQAANVTHPAPSPVQHHPHPVHHQHQHHQQHPHQGGPPPQQQHPPSSVTPQHHLIYQQQQPQQQQQHQQAAPHPPPLQPSPHTPTSPQSMYPPPIYYSYTQAGMQGVPQMTFAHTAPNTTVTHSHQQQHHHVAQPTAGTRLVMVPQHQATMQQAQMGAPPANQMPQHPQMQHHHMHGPMPGQGGPPMMPQQPQGISVSSGGSSMHPQPAMYHVPHPHPQSYLLYRVGQSKS